MNVIALSTLRSFWQVHQAAETALRTWHNVLRAASPQSFSGMKQVFNTVDMVAPYTIFDIGGNKYRIVAKVSYTFQTAHIKHVFTHKEYDKWKP